MLLHCRMSTEMENALNTSYKLIHEAMISNNKLPNSPDKNASKTNITIINGPTLSNSRVLPNTFNAETSNDIVVRQAIEIFQHFNGIILNTENKNNLKNFIIRVAKKCIDDDDLVNLNALFIGTNNEYNKTIYDQFFAVHHYIDDYQYTDVIDKNKNYIKNNKPKITEYFLHLFPDDIDDIELYYAASHNLKSYVESLIKVFNEINTQISSDILINFVTNFNNYTDEMFRLIVNTIDVRLITNAINKTLLKLCGWITQDDNSVMKINKNVFYLRILLEIPDFTPSAYILFNCINSCCYYFHKQTIGDHQPNVILDELLQYCLNKRIIIRLFNIKIIFTYKYNEQRINYTFKNILEYAAYNRFISSLQLLFRYTKEDIEPVKANKFNSREIKHLLNYTNSLLQQSKNKNNVFEVTDFEKIIRIIKEEYPLINSLESKFGRFVNRYLGGHKTRKSKMKSKRSNTVKANKQI